MSELKLQTERESFHPLTEEEKSRMRDVVRWHMRANPLPKQGFERYFKLGHTGFTLFNTVYLNYRYIPLGAMMLAIMLTVSLGSFAAEVSAPGDKLYSWKQANEGVRGALTWYPDAEASWQIDKAERRLGELLTLAGEGTLTEVTKTDLSAEISTSLMAITTSIARYNETRFGVSMIVPPPALETNVEEKGQHASLLRAELSTLIAARSGNLNEETLAGVKMEQRLAVRIIDLGNRLLAAGLTVEADTAYSQAIYVLTNLKSVVNS